VIAPHFSRRLSGVTSTVVRLVSRQAAQIPIVAVGPGLPASLPQVSILSLLTMSRFGPDGWRVWHARRNIEMLAGLALRVLLGKRLKLIFTSASQRNHSHYMRWLIRRMDAVLATSD
jgi:mannosyltransferase